jgi:hypothetical protein
VRDDEEALHAAVKSVFDDVARKRQH